MTDEESLILARQADGVMENPAVKQAFEDIESHYTSLWKSSGPSEYELREECHVQLYALAQFRRQLRSYLETGKLLSAASQNQASVGHE
ncbi:MAG: hypothetical protein GY772_32565 [bacterium]|jgi:hypothetical protein|nr:hypothetical protein [Roseobacter sp.]MCP4245295.1 hypothetical protein [bacterium]|tara:strand:- start:81 stop:347 length:267 start_codon:yes stop_codon:yes gene_type:complete